MWKRYQAIALAGCLSFQAFAADPPSTLENGTAQAANEGGQLTYVGNVNKITVAYDSEYELSGELFLVLDEEADSSWLANAWVARDAGGIKISRHWLANGDPEDPNGDFTVYKLFLAADQNEYQDRKVTAGWGMEKPDYFIDAYAAAAITGERDQVQSSSSVTETLHGEENGIPYTQDLTTTTFSTIYSHPYDYGVGFRVGHFFDEQLIRGRVGLDYEWGDEDASQVTLSMSGEKFFANTPHSVGVRADYYSKSGDLDADNDFRFNLFYRYSFGQPYKPAKVAETVYTEGEQLIRNEIALDANALFDFDNANLRPDARKALSELVTRLREAEVVGDFSIVGHTCNIGTVEYNQRLSERRAASVQRYLAGQGFERERLKTEGRGELNPTYPNDTEASRRKNRRVDITVLTARPVMETVRIPTVHWKSEPVKIQRALHNPVEHKRRVDYYRIEKTRTTTELGDRVPANQPPIARDDTASAPRNSAGISIDVLANDSDPDGDNLSVLSTSLPTNGTVINNGDRVTYIPASDFSGVDTFSYTASDGKGGTGSASVVVTVSGGAANRAPDAVDDQAVTRRNTAVDIPVLSNDSDPDGDPLTVAAVTQPDQGSVANHGDYVTFTPSPGASGTYTFTYTASDGRGGSDSAKVTVKIPVY